ncbi:hypothetical protein [Gloeothece citriformis]|uniref:hypothetical protein n=1 Tax=Gloeothece citriformis TaxID=2546356 RepID=UPI000173BECB|nr:hypothetical protein [Gloeothece citriformis]
MRIEQLSLFPTAPSDSIYLSIEGNIPTDLPNGAFISLKRNTPLKIYFLGFQPAKSIPEIPRWFLHKYGKNPLTILEPFAGSGTTILESLHYRASVDWLDYHPLSRLICQVKTHSFNCQQVLETTAQIIFQATHKHNAPNTIAFLNLVRYRVLGFEAGGRRQEAGVNVPH